MLPWQCITVTNNHDSKLPWQHVTMSTNNCHKGLWQQVTKNNMLPWQWTVIKKNILPWKQITMIKNHVSRLPWLKSIYQDSMLSWQWKSIMKVSYHDIKVTKWQITLATSYHGNTLPWQNFIFFQNLHLHNFILLRKWTEFDIKTALFLYINLYKISNITIHLHL